MKILMTTETVGGVWHYSVDLATCLTEEKMEVVLVAMGPAPGKCQEAEIKALKKLGVAFYHQTYQLEWMDNPWEDVQKAGVWVQSIFDKEKPDLMHFSNYAMVAMGWKVPVVLVAHSCVVSWWQAVKKEPLPERYYRYSETVQEAFNLADVVVSPSLAQLKIYREIYGDKGNQKVIYNGITPAPDYNSNKLPILFSMGRLWDDAKNVELIVKAAPRISGEIFIAGADPKKMTCPKNVTFLGELSRSQIFNWLKISCGYVLPVKYEPFGLTFLEAATHRTALIGGDIPTLREIWGESMHYVDTDDYLGLAVACNMLLNQKESSILGGEKAYIKSQLYTLKKMGNEYLKIYEGVLTNSTVSG